MAQVISGFVVSGSLLRKRHATLLGLLAAFYSRRAKRLSPALVLMVGTASLACALFLSPDVVLDLSEYLTAARFALLGFSNNVFAARPDGCEAALY